MTQNKNLILNYLKYLNHTLGIQRFQLVEDVKDLQSSIESETIKKIFWKSGQEFLYQELGVPTSKSPKYLFINQNKLDHQVISLFHRENWEVFKKMVLALGIQLKDIEVWETNEEEIQEIFHFLLDYDQLQGVILLLNEPVLEKNIYPYNKAKVLETYSPLLFKENADLKRKVWNHFKDYRALN